MYQPRRASAELAEERPVADAFHVGPRRAAPTRSTVLRTRLAPAAVSLTMLATAGGVALHLGTQQGATAVPAPAPERESDQTSRSLARTVVEDAPVESGEATDAWADEVPPADAPAAANAGEPVINQAFVASSWADSFGTVSGSRYAQSDLKVREQASGDAPSLGTLDKGDQVSVTDKEVDGFVQVAFESRIGYVKASLLGAEPPKGGDAIAMSERGDAQAGPQVAAKSNGKLFWPAEGRIGSPWGMRKHPILGYTRMHGGVDIGGSTGQPIYAAEDGVVTKAAYGYNSGSGNNIRIDHGKISGKAVETGYLHLSKLNVKVGQKVKRGQVIGTMGSTGLSTGPHLHFSLYLNGTNSNPAPWLG